MKGWKCEVNNQLSCIFFSVLEGVDGTYKEGPVPQQRLFMSKYCKRSGLPQTSSQASTFPMTGLCVLQKAKRWSQNCIHVLWDEHQGSPRDSHSFLNPPCINLHTPQVVDSLFCCNTRSLSGGKKESKNPESMFWLLYSHRAQDQTVAIVQKLLEASVSFLNLNCFVHSNTLTCESLFLLDSCTICFK